MRIIRAFASQCWKDILYEMSSFQAPADTTKTAPVKTWNYERDAPVRNTLDVFMGLRFRLVRSLHLVP